MPKTPAVAITQLLQEWKAGDTEALERLMPLVHDELRRLARQHMGRERPGHTLQPTALVHEAYLRLLRIKSIQWADRDHFFAVAARLMRRILVDSARARRAQKRGDGQEALPLDHANGASNPDDGLLALENALVKLEAFDERKARVVELRFFTGQTVEEAARVLQVSPRTVKRDWLLAKAFLASELSGLDDR